MTKKTVLAFIDWYRPGYKAGGTVTSFGNFVDYLEPHFDFKIVTRDTDFMNDVVYESVHSDTWNTLEETECYYMSSSNLSYASIKKIMLKTSYDVVYINGVFSFYFSILPLFLSRGRHCIMNPHGMLSDQAFSVKSLKKKVFLQFANIFGLFKHVIFHVSNEDEAEAVKRRIKSFKSIQIANQFPRKLKQNFQPKTSKQKPIRFINIARVSIEKGTLKMLQALQSIAVPIVLDLYGPIYDQSYWDTCTTVIDQLPGHINVTYKGVLASEDVPLTLHDYDFFVLLSEGENFGHAILEALSAGLPVLISDKTPWKALESKSIGWDVNINNTELISKTFTDAIEMTDAAYSKWSSAAFAYAKAFTDNPELIKQNKALFLNGLN
jgi:glycosyltransferase involved in cell wall biosynthesis